MLPPFIIRITINVAAKTLSTRNDSICSPYFQKSNNLPYIDTMRKSLLFLTLAGLIGTAASARTLTPEQALARALSNDNTTATAHRAPMKKTPVMTLGETDVPAIYIFDQGAQGYLIVSADDVAAPVLGYSSTGTIDPENIPDNMRWWLSQYEAEIAAARSNGEESYDESSRPTRTPIEPLLKTTWDQGTPYSTYCPMLDGERTVTGCVATAMAQVMNYHKWPEKFNADFSYWWDSGLSTLSWKQEDVTLDWANMLDSYKVDYTPEQADAVALLMRACGYSVDMDYNIAMVGGSGTSSLFVLDALVNTFDYDKGASVAFRKFYSLAEWENLIYHNLANCGPTVYSGSNASIGHCFVCDGYSTDGYFHFNWGWSGSSDGYFLLTALNPTSQGIGGSNSGYNIDQTVTLGIRRPADGAAAKLNILCDGTLWANKNENGSFTISGGFYNFTPAVIKGQFGFRFIDETDGKVEDMLSREDSYGYRYGIRSLTFPEVPEGTYRIYPIFKPAEGEPLIIPCPVDQAGYIIVSNDGFNVKVSAPEVGRYSISDVAFDTPLYKDMEFLVKGKAQWTGSFSSSVTVYGVLMTGTTPETIVACAEKMQQEFPADNELVDFEYMSKLDKYDKNAYPTGLPKGDYYFALALEDPASPSNWKLISNPIEVTLKNNPGDANITITSFSVEDRNNVDPDNIVINMKVKCNAGYFFTHLIVAMFNQEGKNCGQFNTNTVYIAPGETKDITVNAQLPNAVAGEVYRVIPFTSSRQQLPIITTCTIGDRSGITNVTADNAALTASPNPAVDYTVVSAASEISSVGLVAVSGRVVSVPAEINGNTARLDVSGLAPGLYICRVITTAGAETVKIVKK